MGRGEIEATGEGEETPKPDQENKGNIEATRYVGPVITKEEGNPGKEGDTREDKESKNKEEEARYQSGLCHKYQVGNKKEARYQSGLCLGYRDGSREGEARHRTALCLRHRTGNEEEEGPEEDGDVPNNNNGYESATAAASQFPTVFVRNCGSGGEEVECGPLLDLSTDRRRAARMLAIVDGPAHNLKGFGGTSQVGCSAGEEVSLAGPSRRRDNTAAPSERLVPGYQAGESASEAAKLRPPQEVELVPRDRLVELQGILSGNNKDGGNAEDDARLPELVRYLPRLLFHREELRTHIGRYSRVTWQCYEQCQANHDAAAQARMIQTTSVTSEEDSDQLSSICTKVYLIKNSKDGGSVGDYARFLKLIGDRANRAADCAVCATHVGATRRMNRRVTEGRERCAMALATIAAGHREKKGYLRATTGIPSERLGAGHQDGEGASEAAKLEPPQAEERVPPDRLGRLQGILNGNIEDGGNAEDDARPLEHIGHLPGLLLRREEPRSLSRRCSRVNLRCHEQHQAGYDAAAQAQMIAEDRTTATASHRERRKYLSTAHEERVRAGSDQPGLLGPKTLQVLKGRDHGRDESNRQLGHNRSPPPRQGKVESREDLEDRCLHERLFHMEELGSIIGRYIQVSRRHHERCRAGDDGAGLARVIRTTTATPEEDNDQLSSICTKLFGDSFQRCYGCPAQNSFIIAFPLIGGRFSDTTNGLGFATGCHTGGKGPGKGGSRTSDQMNATFQSEILNNGQPVLKCM